MGWKFWKKDGPDRWGFRANEYREAIADVREASVEYSDYEFSVSGMFLVKVMRGFMDKKEGDAAEHAGIRVTVWLSTRDIERIVPETVELQVAIYDYLEDEWTHYTDAHLAADALARYLGPDETQGTDSWQ